METTVKKDKYHGWTAETEIVLAATEYEGKPANRVLSVSTSKSNGVVLTTASVCLQQDEEYEGRKWRRQIHVIFEDFMERVQREPVKTATEKAVRAAHEKAMLGIEAIKARAAAHYTATN